MNEAVKYRYLRVPALGCPVLIEPDNRMLVIEPEVGTREATRILQCSMRKVQDLCDRGELREGEDWWRLPGGRTVYRITRSALARYQARQKEKNASRRRPSRARPHARP